MDTKKSLFEKLKQLPIDLDELSRKNETLEHQKNIMKQLTYRNFTGSSKDKINELEKYLIHFTEDGLYTYVKTCIDPFYPKTNKKLMAMIIINHFSLLDKLSEIEKFHETNALKRFSTSQVYYCQELQKKIEKIISQREKIIDLHISDPLKKSIMIRKDPISKTTLRISNILTKLIDQQIKISQLHIPKQITGSNKNRKMKKIKLVSKRFIMLKNCVKLYETFIKNLNL